MIRILFLLIALWAVSAPLAQAQDTPTSIPSTHSNDLRQLWRSVMTGFYGPYDSAKACWVNSFAVDHEKKTYCMRPHKLDIVEGENGRQFYFVIGGFSLPRTDLPIAPGALGLLVLREDGDIFTVQAKHLVREVGFYGKIPAEEFFDFRQIGPNGKNGWVMETGYYHGGVQYGLYLIYGALGDDIVELGYVPSGVDDTDICEARSPLFTGEGCTNYFGELSFLPEQTGENFPISIQFDGLFNGEQISRDYAIRFDPALRRYVLPDDYPFVWRQD